MSRRVRFPRNRGVGRPRDTRTARMELRIATVAAVACAWAALYAPSRALAEASAVVEVVNFQSADAKTKLVGYVFRPAEASAVPLPAVVMMHGRAGAYSS